MGELLGLAWGLPRRGSWSGVGRVPREDGGGFDAGYPGEAFAIPLALWKLSRRRGFVSEEAWV